MRLVSAAVSSIVIASTLAALCPEISRAEDGFAVPILSRGDGAQRVAMRFVGANPQPEMFRVLEYAGRKPDSVANEPAPQPVVWSAGPPVEWRVVYKDIYPGIDMVTYKRDGRVQYDLIVNPRASLSSIRIVYEGFEKQELCGTFPAYQVVGGTRVDVPVEVQRQPDACYILAARSYDPSTELVIPTTSVPLSVRAATLASRR